MHRNLGVERVRQQAALCIKQREAGFITGGFNSENEHVVKVGAILAWIVAYSFEVNLLWR
jgi:hypothetical protein